MRHPSTKLRPYHLRHLGGALLQLRSAAGLTQAQLCARAGWKTPQLSRWENDHDRPTFESLLKFLNAVGANLIDLERALLDEESQARKAFVAKALRQICADSRKHIASSSGLLLAVEEIMCRSPRHLERWHHFLGEKIAEEEETLDV
ncbi:MAG: helix-turn-helix transcriptional regulator [bacterium]|nr:helix-turn-helix transcriptional regulator [bacterium]